MGGIRTHAPSNGYGLRHTDLTYDIVLYRGSIPSFPTISNSQSFLHEKYFIYVVVRIETYPDDFPSIFMHPIHYA